MRFVRVPIVSGLEDPGWPYLGVVLAGTYSWGEAPLERLLPRPLLPVADTPLICYALRWLEAGGIDRATICANSSSDRVRTRVGDGASLSMKIRYYEDLTPRGAAGCVLDAARGCDAKTLVVVDGTAIPTVEIDQLLTAHVLAGAAVSVVGHRDPGHSVQGYRPLTPAGIYVIARRVLDYIPEKGFQDIKESLIPRLYQAGERVLSYAARGGGPRVLNAETYLAVNHWMIEQIARKSTRHEVDRGQESVIHASARVDRDATLVGPVLVGPEVVVEAGAILVGPTSVGLGSRVCSGALVSRSVIWSDCVVGREAVVDRCLLGDNTRVEARAALVGSLKVDEFMSPSVAFEGDWLSDLKLGPAREIRTPGFAIAFPGRMGVA